MNKFDYYFNIYVFSIGKYTTVIVSLLMFKSHGVFNVIYNSNIHGYI